MSVLESSILFFVFFGLVIVMLTIKKFYYKHRLKKKFNIIPRANTKGITNIGMTVALSIAIILLLTFITADIASVIFRAWPGTRIIFESILIKIGGLLFGPIVGMCIGAATDFLTISLTGGVFHIGYFLSAIFFGLIGGIIKYIVNLSHKDEFKFCLYSTILFIITWIVTFILLFFISGDQNWYKLFSFSFLGVDIDLRLWSLILLLSFFILLTIIFMWFLYFYRWKHYQWIEKGKLLEETESCHYNNIKLYKINKYKIKKLLKGKFNNNNINVLALIASNNGISQNNINQYFNNNLQIDTNTLLTYNYIEQENNLFKLSKPFATELMSCDFFSIHEKIWKYRYNLSKKSRIYSGDKKWFMSFIPVFVCIVLSELVVNIVTIPAYDAVLSTLSYETWLLIRILLFIPMIVINLIVIFPIFKIITPNIDTEIEDDVNNEIV